LVFDFKDKKKQHLDTDVKGFSWPVATFVNMCTVVAGSIIGLLLQQVFTEGIESMVFQAIGLGTILISLKMMLKLPDGWMLPVIFSLVLGGISGELLQLDVRILSITESFKELLNIADTGFSEGLITAFLLFCIGSMTIVGAIEEGLQGKRTLIYVKSTLDGFAAIALTSAFGIGVMFSVIPMLIFQGGITVFSSFLKNIFTEKAIEALSATGGVLIMGIAINMLNLGVINLEKLLPALLYIIIFARFKR
jgi:uncharacterized protein